MSEAEYRLLCNHLGHSLDVHTRFYRLRETTAEFTKVGKMLASTQPNLDKEGMSNPRPSSMENSEEEDLVDVQEKAKETRLVTRSFHSSNCLHDQ